MTRRKFYRAMGLCAATLCVCRVLVLVLESVAVVHEERDQDKELLEACQAGVGRESSKMRTACLAAKQARASPLIVKALVRSASTAFAEFSASVQSPYSLGVACLFVAMQLSPFVRGLLSLFGGRDDRDDQDDHRDGPQPHLVLLDSRVARRAPHLRKPRVEDDLDGITLGV